MKHALRIGALISGTGTNLQAVMDACDSGYIPGRVVFAGADTASAKGLERAAAGGITTFVVDYADFFRRYRAGDRTVAVPDDCDFDDIWSRQRLYPQSADRRRLIPRLAAEALLLDRCRRYDFDLLILAGFMRSLSPYFIDHVNVDPAHPRIMNIHPALLPAFPGTDGYGDTLRYGCKLGGCTVHFVDYGEDTGPIIAQRSFDITAEDTLESVRKKGLALEWALYPECIRLYALGRLRTERRRYRLPGGKLFERTVVVVA